MGRVFVGLGGALVVSACMNQKCYAFGVLCGMFVVLLWLNFDKMLLYLYCKKITEQRFLPHNPLFYNEIKVYCESVSNL